jgi:hypothetical protein
MIRPTTSDVSALSGSVANSRQAIHFGSSAPSKIPYGGFSPVRLQAGCQPRPSSPSGGFDAATVEISSVRVLFRNRACARRHASLLTPHTRPVALGSASGFAVRQPHRLLWPHPSFCAAPPVSSIMADGPVAAQKVPTFICQSLMTCRRPYSEGSRNRARIQTPGLAFAHLEGARQPCDPHTGLRVVDFTKLQRSHTAAARHLVRPAPDGTFTTELACPGSLRAQVGYNYRNVRLIPDRTLTGCSDSLVGCTPNKSRRDDRA